MLEELPVSFVEAGRKREKKGGRKKDVEGEERKEDGRREEQVGRRGPIGSQFH